MTRIEELVKLLIKAKDAYYNDEPIMTDEEFDAFEDELRGLDPENDYFSIVGAVNSKCKTTHLIPMLSAGKGKVLSDIEAWLKKITCQNEELIIEPKIDGMSANLVYENGKLVLVATRGDGKVGQDITHVSKYMKLPKTINLKNRIEIRGEIYLPKNTTINNPEKKPLRNMAVGLVNRKDSGLEDLKYLCFTAYQVFGSSHKTESGKMLWLEDNKFSIGWYHIIKANQLQDVYDAYMSKYRAEWLFETDGLMIIINDNSKWDNINSKYVVEHHNHYNIAWKGQAEAKETILVDIEWNVSRQGKLIPVAIVEPVNIAQRMVSRASLTSYENVLRMKLEKGDKILMEVSGDVIPYLTKNITKNVSQR